MTSPLTTHVLDVAKGIPAQGIAVTVERMNDNGEFVKQGDGKTNQDGRVIDLLKAGQFLPGTYRLAFDTGTYHKGEGFFPFVHIVFVVKDPSKHHHVPVLLSPFGYSTYRGS